MKENNPQKSKQKQQQAQTRFVIIVLALIAFAMIAVVALPTIRAMMRGDLLLYDGQNIQEVIELDVEGVPMRLEVPALDMRGYPLAQSDIDQWFLERINYHRVNFGIHPFEIYLPSKAAAIEHSLEMTRYDFTDNRALDGRTHQERHDRWYGINRTRVTSSSVRTIRNIEGQLTREMVHGFVDKYYFGENDDPYESFIMNPYYFYIGIGFSINERGVGRLCISWSSQPGYRADHRARGAEERVVFRQNYLEKVREERGWEPE